MTEQNHTIAGTAVPVRGDSIESDQILPADATDPEDLFAHAGDGVVEYLHDGRFTEANVLLVNREFGSDESRPELTAALADWGIEAVIGESFGDGFLADCRSAGITTATASERDLRAVQEWVLEHPGGKLKVDIEDELLLYGVRNHDEREGDTYQPGFAAEEFVSVTVAD